jgi:hypothetical protein
LLRGGRAGSKEFDVSRRKKKSSVYIYIERERMKDDKEVIRGKEL